MRKLSGVLIVCIFISWCYGQVSVDGCQDLSAADLEFVDVIRKGGAGAGVAEDPELHDLVQMDFAAVVQGGEVVATDIYYILRAGSLRRFDGINNTVSEIGNFDVVTDQNHGLRGIALHPDFNTNNYIFLYMTHNRDVNGRYSMKLSRFTLNPDKSINVASEKILIDLHGGFTQNHHHGGPMTFDRHGHLWLTIGNNSPDHNNGGAGGHVGTDSTFSDVWGPSNTASLRGSILRIIPDESAKGYSVPTGNFGEHFAAWFEDQGEPEIAAKYRDETLMLPEIYSKGHRSNWSITAHPTHDIITEGEVNPASSDDEFNIIMEPMFTGYPYFYGDQKLTDGHSKDPLAPINDSPISSGIPELPPSQPGTINGLAAVAISGPIYVFDETLNSSIKLSRHFSDHWFQFDFNRNMAWTTMVDTEGNISDTKEQSAAGAVFADIPLFKPLAADMGPDGALYVLNMGGALNNSSDQTGIIRVEYHGDCAPIVKARYPERIFEPMAAEFLAGKVVVKEKGDYRLEIRNTVGALIATVEGKGAHTYGYRRDLKMGAGVHTLTLVTESGSSSRVVVNQ